MQVSCFMSSWYAIQSDKRMKAIMAEGLSWNPITILDSGVFSFMNKAGVTHQKWTTKLDGLSSWSVFKKYAATYIAYLREHAQEWDWIIELDVDELYGIEAADAFRAKLLEVVGERLLPVWHGQRGDEGWKYLVHNFPYICLSPSKATGSRLSSQTGLLFRQMIDYAHANGTRVHILGDASYPAFLEYGHDTADASSWLAGSRWGEVKLPKVGRLRISSAEIKSSQKAPFAAQLKEVQQILLEHGYTLKDALEGADGKLLLNLAMLMLREGHLRERARRMNGHEAIV